MDSKVGRGARGGSHSTKAEDTRLENNNVYWDALNISSDEMTDMGVELLGFDASDTDGDDDNAGDERCPLTSEVYNVYSAGESLDFESSKRAKPIQEERFIYKKRSREANTDQDVLCSLSDEILLAILRHLSHGTLASVACVCRRFARLARDESLWRRLDLGSTPLAQDTLGHVLSRGTRVLRLAAAKVMSPAFMETKQCLEGFTSKLEYLDLSACGIAVKDLESLLSTCVHLRKLSLEACQLSETALTHIGANANLDTLNCCLATGIEPVGLSRLLDNCTRLTEVNFGWCLPSGECVSLVCAKISTSLRQLNLSGAQLTLTDNDVRVLVSRCSGLTVLDISDCLEITSEVVGALVRHTPRLRVLSASRCFRLAPSALLGLRGMKELEKVNVYKQVSGEELSGLHAVMPHVKFNCDPFSKVARPTVGVHRTSIWMKRCRE